MFVTIDGKRRKITKREVIVTQMVNNAAGADLRDQDADGHDEGHRTEGRRGSTAGAPSLHPADKQVIKHMLERIQGKLLKEIQETNTGNPALAMISLPPACADRRASQATSPADGAV